MDNLKFLVKDFLRSGNSGKIELPKNHENIEWIIKNCAPDSTCLSEFLRYKDDPNISFNQYSKKFISIISSHENIQKRIEFLIEKGFRFSDEGCSLVRLGSLEIFKLAVKNGLDVNHYNELLNYPLRNSILRMKPKITDYIWSLPNIRKDLLDQNKENIAHIAVRKEKWKIIIDEFKESPEKFQAYNNNWETPVDLLLKINFENISQKNIKLMTNTLVGMVDMCEKLADFNNLNPTLLIMDYRKRYEKIKDNVFFHNFIILNNYNNLNAKLVKKEEQLKKSILKL